MTNLTDGSGPPHESLLAKADERLGKIETTLNLIAALFIFGLMFLGVANVVGRKLFNQPVVGYIDIVEVTMVVFAFLGIAYCQRVGGHVRMEILLRRLKGRPLWIVEAIGVLIGLVAIAVLTWYGIEHAVRAYRLGDSTMDLRLPVWPAKLVVPIAFVVLWLRLLLQFVGYSRLAADPDREPIGVPLMESVSEQAKHEVEELFAEDEDRDRDARRIGGGPTHG